MTKKPKPSELPLEADEIYRAKWTTPKREAYFKEHPENFAGPDGTYPIEDASDVNDAWRLAGHASDPDAVRAKIKSIAKRLGLESGLPDTAKDEERSTTPDTSLDPKEPMKDKVKPKSPEDTELERSLPSPDVLYYAPITRFDKEKREVIGVATAEVKDMHRTVIGYEGSKDAFSKWRGNIREMHDPKKAVGRALEITPDDDNRRIIVRARISKGAEDTWQKVLDGTLTGFSIGGKNGVWTERTIDGEKVPYLERYDQAELSLVDNPSCPVANFEIVRADGIASDVLAPEDEAETEELTRVEDAEVERASVGDAVRDGMHGVRDQLHDAHKQVVSNCGCDECQSHAKALSRIKIKDDNDGDIDANELAKPGAARAMIAEIVKEQVADTLRTQIGPVIQRINALLAHDAGRAESPDFTRNFTSLSEKHDALASQIKDIADLVQKIAEQPTSGGPLMHGVQKQLATAPAPARAEDADIIRRATELGFAPPSDPQAAVRAAAALVRPIPR